MHSSGARHPGTAVTAPERCLSAPLRPTHGSLKQRASQPHGGPDAGCTRAAKHGEWGTTRFRRPRMVTCDWGLRTHPRECFPGLKGQGRCPVSPWKGTSLCGISGQVGAYWMVTEPHPGFLVSAARRDTAGPLSHALTWFPVSQMLTWFLVRCGQTSADWSTCMGMASRGRAVHQHGLADAVLEPKDVQTF